MKNRKIFIRVGAALLFFIAAVLAVRAILNFTEGRALAGTISELKTKGVPLTAADLSAPCPDSENAARLWKAAEEIIAVNEQKDIALMARVWTEFMNSRTIPAADRAALRDLILRNRRAFELLTAMKDKPCFLYRDPRTILLEAKIPNALRMIRATRLFLFSACLEAEQGNMRQAIDQIETGLAIAPMVAQEGSLLSCLVGFADARMLAYYLGDILRAKAVEESDLLKLMTALDPGPWPGRLAAAMRGERVAFIEMGRAASEGGSRYLQFLWGKLSFFERAGLWLIRPLLMRDIRESLPLYADLEKQAMASYPESRVFFRTWEAQMRHRPWYAFVSKSMVPNVEAAFLKEAQLEAACLVDQVGLASRLYKGRTGRYPESLEALVPDILTEIPIDPFTGKPFVYRREGEGFIVYSLGSNQKDDGGRSTYMITQLVMDKDDDWTWKEEK